MSQTMSIGVTGPSHWSFMAGVMADRLQKIATLGRVEAGVIPGGIYNDARQLLRLVLQAADDGIPDNPPASINAYVIALDAMKGVSQSLPKTRRELKERLDEYLAFVCSLREQRTLAGKEVDIAKSLAQFFQKLHEDGESEAYERRVYFGAPLLKLA
jgi:hypothetical protein